MLNRCLDAAELLGGQGIDARVPGQDLHRLPDHRSRDTEPGGEAGDIMSTGRPMFADDPRAAPPQEDGEGR
jgi:hypothetical protein